MVAVLSVPCLKKSRSSAAKNGLSKNIIHARVLVFDDQSEQACHVARPESGSRLRPPPPAGPTRIPSITDVRKSVPRSVVCESSARLKSHFRKCTPDRLAP